MPLALMFLGILCSVAGSFPLYTYAIHLSDHDIRWTSRERLRPRIWHTDLEKHRRLILLEIVSPSINVTSTSPQTNSLYIAAIVQPSGRPRHAGCRSGCGVCAQSPNGYDKRRRRSAKP
ncbi:hypothetical protein C8Q73DRAFT_201759 [Cubamyces lactineus]|nr:hypothetical protein C8Q73DRAFT_201759 [Cubamyces lactineus]